LPALDEVERVAQGGLGEENPLKCENEEDCSLKYRYLIDRSNQAAKRENGECDNVPESEKTICNLFLGVGKRELNSVVPSLKETPAPRKRRFANPLTRDLDLDPFCHYPFCRYSPPGKKKFMVKKAASETDHEEKVNAVPSSDTNGNGCSLKDVLCQSNGGLGRKRSIRSKLTKLVQDNCGDQDYSNTHECRWPAGRRRKRTFSSLDENRIL